MLNNLYKNVLPFLIIFMSLQVSLFASVINIDELAKKLPSNKHLLVFIHTTDCGYCESMIEFTFDNEKNAKLMKEKFQYIHINVKEEGTVSYKDFTGSHKEFAIYIKRNIYPSTLYFDSKANKVFAHSGYVDEDNYYDILTYIDTKSYTSMRLSNYIKQQSKSK